MKQKGYKPNVDMLLGNCVLDDESYAWRWSDWPSVLPVAVSCEPEPTIWSE